MMSGNGYDEGYCGLCSKSASLLAAPVLQVVPSSWHPIPVGSGFLVTYNAITGVILITAVDTVSARPARTGSSEIPTQPKGRGSSEPLHVQEGWLHDEDTLKGILGSRVVSQQILLASLVLEFVSCVLTLSFCVQHCCYQH